MGDSEQRLLDIYIKRTNDETRKYIIFDHETWIPYLYDTNRSSILRIYMEPDDSCVITSKTIDLYTNKNRYKKAFSLIMNDGYSSIVEDHHVINNMNEFKRDMNFVLKHDLFKNYDKNIINMIRKVVRVMKSIE